MKKLMITLILTLGVITTSLAQWVDIIRPYNVDVYGENETKLFSINGIEKLDRIFVYSKTKAILKYLSENRSQVFDIIRIMEEVDNKGSHYRIIYLENVETGASVSWNHFYDPKDRMLIVEDGDYYSIYRYDSSGHSFEKLSN